MKRVIIYTLISIYLLINISCQENLQKTTFNLNSDMKPMDSIKENKNEFIENLKRPNKTIIRNLTVDTNKIFGIWVQEPESPHADFWINSKSFYIVDYDGSGHNNYILDKNEITIFYEDFIQKGTISISNSDTLKIKWSDMEIETDYLKFNN